MFISFIQGVLPVILIAVFYLILPYVSVLFFLFSCIDLIWFWKIDLGEYRIHTVKPITKYYQTKRKVLGFGVFLMTIILLSFLFEMKRKTFFMIIWFLTIFFFLFQILFFIGTVQGQFSKSRCAEMVFKCLFIFQVCIDFYLWPFLINWIIYLLSLNVKCFEKF